MVTKQVSEPLSSVFTVVVLLFPKTDQSGLEFVSLSVCAVEEITGIVVVTEEAVCTCEAEADTGAAVVCGCVVQTVVFASAVVTAASLSVIYSVVLSCIEKVVVLSGFADEQPPSKNNTIRNSEQALFFFNFISSEKRNVLSQGKDAVILN